MFLKAFLLTGLFFVANYTFCQPLELTESGRIAVGNRMGYWQDTTDTVAIDNVEGLEFNALKKQGIPNFGFDYSAYWFKMELINNSTETEWLLEVDFAPLDQVDFYIQDSTAKWVHMTGGDLLPLRVRDVSHRHPVFPFTLQVGQTQTVYLHIKTISSVQVPAIIWSQKEFAQASYHIQIINGLFYGAMFIMVFYQLFLFFSIRDKITFYYVLTLLAMTNVVSFFQGYNFLYLHPSRPVWNDIFAIISGPAFIATSTLLTRAFLDLRKLNKWLDNLLLANMLTNVFIGILMFIYFREISYKYHHYFVLSHCFIALLCAGYGLYKKYRPSRFYLLGWISPFIAAGFFTVGNLGLLSIYVSTSNSVLMIGCIMLMLFVSFALGDRWSILEKENQRAKQAELEREQEEKIHLENEVRNRTVEIQRQNLQLEEVNHVKDKLLSVVSHDIRGPLGSLHLALNLVKSGSLSAAEFQKVSEDLEARLTHTTEFIDNLLQWAKLQMRGETFEPDRLDLSKLAEESVRLLEPECAQKNIRLQNHFQGSFEAFADLNMVRSVFRNLLTNAIKFTKPNGTISLGAYQVDRKIIVSVADSGVGIPEKNRSKLFTISSVATQGTKQEKGTGLGLLLCKEFVEKNGGTIWFETQEGKGTTFYFSLPEFSQASSEVRGENYEVRTKFRS
ncbi:MAG TPA: sensor histidine kinase [Chryseolinea sp.]|nr:sensor histidine kinase [Chryseolinea sp.]